jgi:hypothetical protein
MSALVPSAGIEPATHGLGSRQTAPTPPTAAERGPGSTLFDHSDHGAHLPFIPILIPTAAALGMKDNACLVTT